MFAIGIGIVSWVVLIAPVRARPVVTGVEKATSMAYPMMDLLLLAVAIRLAAGAGRKAAAFNLIDGRRRGAVRHRRDLRLDAADTHGYTPGVGLLEIGWIAFYILLGAAALHPSMRTVSERAPATPSPRSASCASICSARPALLAPAVQAWSSRPR